MHILFLTPYPPGESPSQRFRFEQYLDMLRQRGHRFETRSFLSHKGWKRLYKPGNSLAKILDVAAGFINRFITLFFIPRFDFVFIHREAAPVGPPIMEWIIARLLKKRIIYDFDDAIWLTDRTHESFLFKWLKHRSKVAAICRWAYKVSCGNEYLCNYARQFNNDVVYNPTTIDTVNLHNPALAPAKRDDENIVIGWTGSHSTLKYLFEIENVLQKLEQRYPKLVITIIANQEPRLNLKRVQFVPWNIGREREDLMQFDIGIMPLPDDEWANGKCGFKALQYMALKIPVVVSAVGVNTRIVDHGVNGFVASTDDEWFDSLNKLIADESLRKKFGELARQKVVTHYSVASNSATFLSLFE